MGMTMVFPRLDCKMKPSLVARYALAGGRAITWMGLAGLVLIAGCAGAPSAVEDMVLLTGVAVDGPKTIGAGESGGFTANAIRSDGGTEDITSKVSWSVVSGPGTVGEGGVYTAPADLTESVPVTIRASYSVSGLTYTQEAAFTATGSSLAGVGKVLAGVSISGPDTVPPGGQGNFRAVASYSDGSTADVTSKAIWEVVGVGTIDARGVYLAPDSVSEDTPTTVKAQYSEVTTPLSKANVQENTKSIVVKRGGSSGLVDVSISGSDTVNQGGRASFTLIATYGNGSTANVTLNSSWQVPSGPGTIGTDGVYLAPAVVSVDTSATIAASYTERGIILKASKKITIPKISRIPVSLTINGPAEVAEGGTGKFSSTLSYNDGSTADVTANVEWSVGGAGTIGAEGLYTAPSLVTSATNVTIRGTYRAATGALSAEKTVQIANTSKVLTGVTISGPAAVAEGANGTYTVTATYDDASTKEVTADATWSVTTGPGTITGGVYSASGTVLADTSVTIAVSYAESGVTRQGTQVITVTNSTRIFSAVDISGTNAVPEGGVANYTATATYDDGTTATVTNSATWSVGSGPGQIDANGVYTAPATVSADTPASLHVSHTESGISKVASKSITVTVGEGPVTLITVGAQWRYKKGNSAPPQNWNTVSFDDSGWSLGASGIGYSTDVVYPTILSDMYNSYASFYARRVFQVSDPAVMAKLSLTLAYDDSFVAYINGVEVARSASMGGIAGSPVYYNTLADASHDEEDPAETFDISLTPGLLQAGNNVLAVEAHNVGLTSSDACAVPQLDGYAGAAVPGNQVPVANAGPDQTVADSDGDGVQAATLYGIGSSDADGTIVGYVWNEGATKLATGVTPIVTLPVGTHTLTLTVTDDGGLSSADTTVITVTQPAADPQTFSHYLKFYQIRYGYKDTQGPLPTDLVDFTLGYDYGHLTKYVYVSFTTILGGELLDRASASGSAIMMNESELDDLFAQKAILSKYNVIAVSFDRIQKTDIDKIQEEMFPGQHLNYGVMLNSSGDVILDSENNSIPDSAIEDYQNGKTIVYPVRYTAAEPTRFFFNFNTPAVREYAIRYALKTQAKSAYRALFIDNFMTNDAQFVNTTGTLHYVSAGTMEDQMKIVANHLIGILNEIRTRPDKDGLHNNGCILNNFRDNSPGQLVFLNEIDRQDKYSVFDMMMCENNFWEDYKCGNIEFYLTWTDKLKAHGKELIYAVSEDPRLDADSEFVEDVWLWLHLVANGSYVYINNRYVSPMIDYSVYSSFALGMPLESPHKEGDTWIRQYQRGTISFDTSSGKMDSIKFIPNN
jgi:hypothetical protein